MNTPDGGWSPPAFNTIHIQTHGGGMEGWRDAEQRHPQRVRPLRKAAVRVGGGRGEEGR